MIDVYVDVSTNDKNKNHIVMLFESVPNLSLEIVNIHNTIMYCETGIGYFLIVMRWVISLKHYYSVFP